MSPDILSQPEQCFNSQIKNLIEKGYPDQMDMSVDDFQKLLQPLKQQLSKLSLPENNPDTGQLQFVIVVKSKLIPAEKMMELAERQGKKGITKLYPLTPDDFEIINSVFIPDSDFYLLADIDRGKKYLNITPENALKSIQADKRSPLTIDEGIAVITQFPEFLMKNNCFSLSGSRHKGDQRVPAIWINGQNQPHLGWCWDRNPHTWLGSASCGSRIAA